MKIDDLILKLNVRLERNAYRGTINGFEFQLTHLSALGAKSYFVSFLLDRSLIPEEIKKIQKVLGMANFAVISGAIQPSNVISVGIRNIEKTRLKLVELTKELKSMGLSPLTTDIYGHDAEVDGYKQVLFSSNHQQSYRIFGLHVPVNLEKFNEKQNQIIESIKKEESKNNQLLRGIFFAIIGALLGAIPSILVYFGGYMLWLLYVLIPLMSFYLYKKGRGPQQPNVPILIGFISFTVGIGSLLYIWYDMATFYGVSLGDLFGIAEISSALLGDLMFCVLGNIFGIYASWKFIYSRTNAAKIKELESIT